MPLRISTTAVERSRPFIRVLISALPSTTLPSEMRASTPASFLFFARAAPFSSTSSIAGTEKAPS